MTIEKTAIQHLSAFTKISSTGLFCLGTGVTLYTALALQPLSDPLSLSLMTGGIAVALTSLSISLWLIWKNKEITKKNVLLKKLKETKEPITNEAALAHVFTSQFKHKDPAEIKKLILGLDTQLTPEEAAQIGIPSFEAFCVISKCLKYLLNANQKKLAAQILEQFSLKKIAKIIIPLPAQEIEDLLKNSAQSAQIQRYLLHSCGMAGLWILCEQLERYPIKSPPRSKAEEKTQQAYIALRLQLVQKLYNLIKDPFDHKEPLEMMSRLCSILQAKESPRIYRSTLEFFKPKIASNEASALTRTNPGIFFG